jgi:hypothetical protein
VLLESVNGALREIVGKNMGMEIDDFHGSLKIPDPYS